MDEAERSASITFDNDAMRIEPNVVEPVTTSAPPSTQEDEERAKRLMAMCSGDISRLDDNSLGDCFAHLPWKELPRVVLVSHSFRNALQVNEDNTAPRFPSVHKPWRKVANGQELVSAVAVAPQGAVICLSLPGDPETTRRDIYGVQQGWFPEESSIYELQSPLRLRAGIHLFAGSPGGTVSGGFRMEDDGNGPCSLYGLKCLGVRSTLHTCDVDSGTLIVEDCDLSASTVGLATSVNVMEHGTSFSFRFFRLF